MCKNANCYGELGEKSIERLKKECDGDAGVYSLTRDR